jgi:hypothetical protein
MKLYSPPNSGHPQELPDRWGFEDGTVRTDLKTLNDAQLRQLNWLGPIYIPVARELDENGNDVLESYDYDRETHKAIWYRAERRYVIVDKDVDEVPYDSGEIVIPEGPQPNWNDFRSSLISSVALNQFLGSAVGVIPVVALALPTIVLTVERDGFDNFATAWTALSTAMNGIPVDLKTELIADAEENSLPVEFINILRTH